MLGDAEELFHFLVSANNINDDNSFLVITDLKVL